MRSAPSRPTVEVCSQTVPGAGAARRIASVTASASCSMVITTSAPSAASAGESNATAPTSVSARAFAPSRFHTRTGMPGPAQGPDHARPHRPRTQHGHDGGGHLLVRGFDRGHSTRATARVGPPCAPSTLSGNPTNVKRVFTTLSRLARFS